MMINHLKNISNKLFLIHFALWHYGGLDSIKERAIWEKMQEVEWLLVSRHKPAKQSYAEVVRANKSSVFSRIRYPEDYYLKNYLKEEVVRSSPRHGSSTGRAQE